MTTFTFSTQSCSRSLPGAMPEPANNRVEQWGTPRGLALIAESQFDAQRRIQTMSIVQNADRRVDIWDTRSPFPQNATCNRGVSSATIWRQTQGPRPGLSMQMVFDDGTTLNERSEGSSLSQATLAEFGLLSCCASGWKVPNLRLQRSWPFLRGTVAFIIRRQLRAAKRSRSSAGHAAEAHCWTEIRG